MERGDGKKKKGKKGGKKKKVKKKKDDDDDKEAEEKMHLSEKTELMSNLFQQYNQYDEPEIEIVRDPRQLKVDVN